MTSIDRHAGVGRLLKWACVAVACCAAQWAAAQADPAKPIRFIVPWSPGSGTDLMSRAFAQVIALARGLGIS